MESSINANQKILFNSIDFSKIKVDDAGLITYQGEEICIKDFMAGLASCAESQGSSNIEKSEGKELLDKSYRVLIGIVITLFFIVFKIQDDQKLTNSSLIQVFFNQAVEGLEDGRQIMGDMHLSLISNYQILEEWAKENPLALCVAYDLVKYLPKLIWQRIFWIYISLKSKKKVLHLKIVTYGTKKGKLK